jgi:hypothetical protein
MVEGRCAIGGIAHDKLPAQMLVSSATAIK